VITAASIFSRGGNRGRLGTRWRRGASDVGWLRRFSVNRTKQGGQGEACVLGKKRGTVERRRLALFVADSSSDPGGGGGLRWEIAPRLVDDVTENQRGVREEGLGYL
jgi:hypothetical protein